MKNESCPLLAPFSRESPISGKPYLEIFLDTHRSLRLRCRDWSHNITAQNIGGYFYDKPSRTLPVFVNYNKDEDAIAYEDHFVSENHMVALSKTKRKVNSSDADHIFKRTEEDKPTRSTSWENQRRGRPETGQG